MKIHKFPTHPLRSSEDSEDSKFTEVTAKTSFDTVASISSISTSLSTQSIPSPADIDTNIFQTNDQLSSQEAVEVHTLLDSKRRKLFELERRKEVLNRQKEFLDRQQRLLDEELGEMSEEIDKYSGVVGCSMRNMPSDLLLEIFHHYVDGSECTSSLGSATVLTHVCRTWRNISLSSPALWVALTAPYITKQVALNVSQRLDQVKAATGLPLELDINLRRSTEVQDEQFQQLSLDLVHASVAQVHRWKSFSLRCEDELFTSGVYEDLFPDISEASRLETLSFSFPQSADWSPIQWITSLVHAAPTLRNLQLKFPAWSTQVVSTLSLSSLESLTIDLPTITPSALLVILRDAAPRLKVCHVRVQGLVILDSDDDRWVAAPSMVVHSCLEIFELRLSRGAVAESLSHLFDSLTLPKAREVLLELGNFQEINANAYDSVNLPDDLELSWPHDSFLGFLERASSSITSLCIGFNPASPESADNAWGGMGSLGSELEGEHVQAYLDLKNVGENLVTLHVRRDRPVWPELLDYLTLPSSPASSSTRSLNSSISDDSSLKPLRNLENIALDIDPIFQVLPMRDFVKSRWYESSLSSSVSRLRSFVITLCFPDIPNLELESAAAKKVFERVTQDEGLDNKLDVVFHRRTYSMMPMDVPSVGVGSELII
ncbi:hypothetical protein J3R30DRAFT_3714210 [Lentinula aciculospora]|uniref:F-box domain-containing protein n=1 Tax=Lentinula aciculospora TaxID=153920 RepID=A0A9W8ZY90_9AGAR|nr:hypothetical protein J3R30DRAFT_3714210 [Lentinula aciculospora]